MHVRIRFLHCGAEFRLQYLYRMCYVIVLFGARYLALFWIIRLKSSLCVRRNKMDEI